MPVSDKPDVKKLLELYAVNVILSSKSSEMLSWEENGAASVKQQFIGAEQHVHILGSGCNSERAFFPAALVIAENFRGLNWFKILGQTVI